MNLGLRHWRTAVAWLIGVVCVPAVAAEHLPISAFFSNAQVGEARLSPSGRYVGMTTAGQQGRMVLAVVDVDAPTRLVVVASDASLDIRSFQWVNDDLLVFNLIDLQSGWADQRLGAGLFSVRRDGTEPRMLISPAGGPAQDQTGTLINRRLLDSRHRLLYVPHDGGTEVIVGEYGWDGLGNLIRISPKRLDVRNGSVASAASGFPSNAIGWTFDPSGAPRVAESVRDGMTEVFWREAGASEWRSLVRFRSVEVAWSPIAVDAANTLYLTRPGEGGTSVLGRFDFKTGRPETEPLASAAGFDFDGLVVFDQGKPAGIRLTTDAETTIWFDPRRKALQALADERLPGRINHTTCADCFGKGAMLVYSYSDRDPGTYWLYPVLTRTWIPIGITRPAIDPRQMSVLDLHRIKARDGRDLPVWITTPRVAAAKPGPAVVVVHGGPWLRGRHWAWNAEAQFLASRGYVVIEPEFRGSAGYGVDHFKSGWKQWGTAMQDDVADAALWAVARGLVDPKRICIAGGSYGGYAALMGPIRNPEVYRCAVAYAAVTDPRLLYDKSWASDIQRQTREYTLPQLMGDLVTDADLLKSATPVERASELRVPVFLAFGRNDRRVPLEHGIRMRSALQAAGREPGWVVYDDEAHGWFKPENRIDFWQRTEQFLARHLQ